MSEALAEFNEALYEAQVSCLKAGSDYQHMHDMVGLPIIQADFAWMEMSEAEKEAWIKSVRGR